MAAPSTSGENVLKCFKSTEHSTFGRLHSSFLSQKGALQLSERSISPTKSKKKTPGRKKKESKAPPPTTPESKSDPDSSLTERLRRFTDVDKLLTQRVDEFLSQRDAKVLDSVRAFISSVQKKPLGRAQITSPFYRLPILTIRAPENLPDYDALFDKISELFNELSDERYVLRFSSFPGGALSGILEQLAQIRRRDVALDFVAANTKRDPGRKNTNMTTKKAAAASEERQPKTRFQLLIIDEVDSWPVETLNAVLSYCARHAIIACVRCIHQLHKYLSMDTLAQLDATVVDAPRMTQAFNELLVDLFISSKHVLPFTLSQQLLSFIRQRFNTCTHSVQDAVNCIRLALLLLCTSTPSAVLLMRDWSQVSDAFGRLSLDGVWQLIRSTPSVQDEVQHMTDLDEPVLRKDLQECIGELDTFINGYGPMFMAMYKLNLHISCGDLSDTAEQRVVFYERMLGVLKELRVHFAEIDKLEKDQNTNAQPLNDQNAVSTPNSRLRPNEKRSWHQLKQSLEQSMKHADANDPVAKLKHKCMKWWTQAWRSFCGGADDYAFYEAFTVALPEKFPLLLHGNTKQAFHTASFQPESYVGDAAPVHPVSLVLRVLCSLCENEAGARKKAVGLKTWFKQWHDCAKDVIPDGVDPVACFLMCVGCAEYVGAVRGAAKGSVQRLYVPPIVYKTAPAEAEK